jgi:FkbM family methyltransferase
VLLRACHALLPRSAELFFGERMNVLLPEPVSVELYRCGYFEAGLSAAMIRLLKPGDTFFDVGSHFGYASLLACALVGQDGQVVAFEPTPLTQAILRQNLAEHSQAKVESFAMWRSPGTLLLNDFGLIGSAFNSFAEPRSEFLSTQSRTRMLVPATTLDEYVLKTNMIPNFIKIDAESAEMAIIEGATQTLSTHRPIVTLEVGDFDIPGVPTSRDLVSCMIDSRYHAYEVNRFRLEKHQLRDRYQYDNLIFLPRPLEQM